MFFIVLLYFTECPISSATTLVEYQFYKNFGQIFQDYSGNNQYAVNGADSTSTTKDTTPTDRGAYFPSSGSVIMMPYNDIVTTDFALPSSFSIITWILPHSGIDYYIFYRNCIACSSYFYLSRDASLKEIQARMVQGVFDSGLAQGQSSGFTPNAWRLISMVVSGITVEIGVNGILQVPITLSSGYTEGTDSYLSYIGGFANGSIKSFVGIVWNFILFSGTISLSEYYLSSYTPSTCLVPTCEPTCTPGMLSDGVGACVSIEMNSKVDGTGAACPGGCSYGCTSSVCLDCTCTTKSCVVSGTSAVCWCPSLMTGSETGCTCNEGYYLNGGSCLSCAAECASCSDGVNCNTCVATWARPKEAGGCGCETGYYGTGPLSLVNSCVVCYDECETCSEALVCDTCVSDNASPNTSVGCSCNNGYYNQSALVSIDSCIYSSLECKTYNVDLTCATCIANNAYPASSGCECDDGYYGSHPLQYYSSCTACYSECKTCQSALLCTECIDPNSTPSPIQGCVCVDGYYFNSASSTCTSCPEDCLTCKDNLTCLVCKGTYSKPTLLGGCDCPANSTLSSEVCTCSDTYYMKYSDDTGSYVCTKCKFPCMRCFSETKCKDCADSVSVSDTGICNQCPEGKYYSNYACNQCSNLCINCTSAGNCSECVGNATGVNNCTCMPGYQQVGNNCEIKYFSASVIVNFDDTISLSFSEALQVPLTAEDLIVLIPKNFSFTLSRSSDMEYLIGLSFSEDIPQGTPANIEIGKDFILSTGGSQLKEYSYLVKLNAYSYSSIRHVIEAVINSTSTIAKTTTFGALCLAIISNPATTWVLINNIQIVSYIPISGNPLSPILRQFLQSFGTLSIFPSISQRLFTANSNNTLPYSEAENDGFSTNLFFSNAGTYIATLLSVLTLFPFFYALSRYNFRFISRKCRKWLQNYRFNFFLRFFIQSYLDLGFYVAIQLKTGICKELNKDTWIECASITTSVLVLVIYI